MCESFQSAAIGAATVITLARVSRLRPSSRRQSGAGARRVSRVSNLLDARFTLPRAFVARGPMADPVLERPRVAAIRQFPGGHTASICASAARRAHALLPFLVARMAGPGLAGRVARGRSSRRDADRDGPDEVFTLATSIPAVHRHTAL